MNILSKTKTYFAGNFPADKYQAEFLEYIDTETGSVDGRSVAGGGKTTCLISGYNLEAQKFETDIMLVAFGRDIVAELKTRLPNANISTNHSHGMKTIKSNPRYKYVKVNDGNQYDSRAKLKRLYPTCKSIASENQLADVQSAVFQIVDMLKVTLTEPTQENIMSICDVYGIMYESNAQILCDCAIKLYKESMMDESSIDFSDMISWPALKNMHCIQYDTIFVDERQDMNASQQWLIENSVRKGGRIIGVGDPDQSIFMWAGADENAYFGFQKRIGAKDIQLNYSYRCPKLHTEYVRRWVERIESHPSAKDGVIEYISDKKLTELMPEDGVVLCRTNAPLIKPAMQLIREHKKAVVLGKDIGRGLSNLIMKIYKKNGMPSLEDTLSYLFDYRDKQCAKLIAMKQFSLAETEYDRCDTIGAIAEDCDSVEGVVATIENIFSDTSAGRTFSSIHKAKGKQWRWTGILYEDLFFPKWGNSIEEKNIAYVAHTRSFDTMAIIERS